MESADVFTALAPFLEARPKLEDVCRFGPQWTSQHKRDDSGWAPFHIITQGQALLDTDDRRGVLLNEGDVVLLPHGGTHALRNVSDRVEALQPVRMESLRNGLTLKTNVDGEAQTQLVCGRLRFARANQNMVLAALPNVIVIHASKGRDASQIRRLVAMMRDELNSQRLGSIAIALDLTRALMTIVLRAHFDSEESRSGVLALLAGAETGRAMRAILADPRKNWTLDDLAHEAGTSRATLVRLFRKASDKAPLALLAEVRLNMAHQRLLSNRGSLAEIAEEVGYGSESALSRAYSRHFGISPGAVRSRGRELIVTG